MHLSRSTSNNSQGAIITSLIPQNRDAQNSKQSQLKVSYNHKILSAPISCSTDSHRFLLRIWDKKLLNLQEQVYILFLNSNSEVIAWRCFHTGTFSQTFFDIKLILSCALGCMADKIIVAHNHPCGDTSPSFRDVEVTTQLKKACVLLDVKLSDHIIVSQGTYYSFFDNNLIA